VSGQPWPMSVLPNTYNHLSAELYFELPDRLLDPDGANGKYVPIQLPKYGRCGVVPVDLRFLPVNPKPGESPVQLMLPALNASYNWAVPYEGQGK